MASFTLTTQPNIPNGATVKAYPESNWPTGIINEGAAPIGTETNSQTAAAGAVTFTGLTDGVRYRAYALVGSDHRYIAFTPGLNRAGDVADRNSVDTDALQDDAVTAAKIAAGAVGTSELANGVVAAVDLAADAATQAELDALKSAGTSLPASPTDGDFYIYNASGVKWMFQYRAASGSAYKWEFIGGAALAIEVTTDQSTTSTSYAALATAGPSLTAPLAGDYDVQIGAGVYNESAGDYMAMSFDTGGAGAVDTDQIIRSAGANQAGNITRVMRRTLAANDALVAKYKVNAGTGHAFNRFMTLLPVRVG